MKNKLNLAALVLFGFMSASTIAAPATGWAIDSSIDCYNGNDSRSYLLSTNYSGFPDFFNSFVKFDLTGATTTVLVLI